MPNPQRALPGMFAARTPEPDPDWQKLVRVGDPATAKRAAKKQTGGRRAIVRTRVLGCFTAYGPMTDRQLIQHYRDLYGETAESTIRTRRSELSAENRLAVCGEIDNQRIWTLP